jgi:hypothetical protein
MYQPGEIAHWSVDELLELWRERVAIATEGGDVAPAKASYEAALEIRRWSGMDWPLLHAEIRQAARNKFRTRSLFDATDTHH